MYCSWIRWLILTRDNFTCQNCGEKSNRYGLFRNCSLSVHHINGDRNDNHYNNLVSLCERCHLGTHDGNWKNKPTKFFNAKDVTNGTIQRALRTHPTRAWNYINRYATETIETEAEIE